MYSCVFDYQTIYQTTFLYIVHVIYIITTLSVLTKPDDVHEWPKHVFF